MQEYTYISDAFPVVNQPIYSVFQFCEPSQGLLTHNCFAIMFCYFDCNGAKQAGIYHGVRTGEPVTFSRLSDADRLCSALNGTGVYGV